MGHYFLFPASQTFQQIQTEKNTPYELTATTDSDSIDLNTLLQIEGVKRISPVLKLNSSLSTNGFELDCEIKAVYSSFLSLYFLKGTIYPDSSNMPYLILNKAAAKSFSQEHQTITVSPEATVMMKVSGADRKAIVCGIFDDGSEMPTVYMSYDVAQKEYGHNGQKELIFLLENKGAAENAVSALQRHNIYGNFDPSITLAWELLQEQCIQTIQLSIGLLACAAVLIREKRKIEIARYRSKTAMLLLSGMTADAVESIYPLRIVITESLAMIITTLGAVLLGKFSFPGIGLSVLAAIIFATIAQLHY